MSFQRLAFGTVAVYLLLLPEPLAAQAREGFARSVAELVNALSAPGDGQAAAIVQAVEAMSTSLQEWDRAIAGVESGLATNIGGAPAPVAARMRAALGAAYLERGRFQDAARELQQGVSLDPGFGEAFRLEATAHTLAGTPELAATAFRAAWLAEPDGHDEAVYLLLRSSAPVVSSAERERLRAALLQAARQAPGQGRALLTFISFDLLDEASLDAPVFVPTRYVEGFELLRQGRYDAAVAALRRTVGSGGPPTSAEEQRQLARGDAFTAAGDFAAAREAYHEATVAAPGSPLAHWRLGQMHLRFADEPNAVKSFEEAAVLGVYAGARHLHTAIGRIYHNQLDLDRAAKAYERAVADAPNHAGGHVDLGEVYRAQDRLDEALTEYLVAALLEPSNARPFALAGQVLAATGRDLDAIPMLEAATRRDSGHLEARYALARALLRVGRAEEARVELQAFERLQAEAMAAERRRFEENARRIEETLAGATKEQAR